MRDQVSLFCGPISLPRTRQFNETLLADMFTSGHFETPDLFNDRRSATLHVTHVLRDHTARSPVEGIMLDPKGRCSKISDFRSPSVAHLRDVSLVSWVRKERRGWCR